MSATKSINAEKSATRRERPRIRVTTDEEEALAIKTQAKAAGLSVSAYLRHVGMGYPIRSILDHERVKDLIRVNTDLGRLGGLLKLWLSNDERLSLKNFPHIDRTIVAAVNKIEANQEVLRDIMKQVVTPRS